MATPHNQLVERLHAPVESIPLAQAVLCVNCEVITAAKNGHCPVCESVMLLNLANILDRQADGVK